MYIIVTKQKQILQTFNTMKHGKEFMF